MEIKLLDKKLNAISGLVDLLEGSRRAILLLTSGTKLIIQNALKIFAKMDIILWH